MEEIWKPIKGYERLYEISNYGRVRSLQRVVDFRGCYKYSVGGKILKLFKDGRGYCIVTLYYGNKKTHRVHHLVWDHFGNEVRDKYVVEIDHKDENKQNNRIDNLQLLTQRRNIIKTQILHKKSGLPTGVFPNGNRFKALIWARNSLIYLGNYKTPEEASNAYQQKLKEVE